MIKMNFKLTNELEKKYIEIFYKEKFNDKPRKTVEEKFEQYKKEYPFNVIFFDKFFEDIVLIKPEKIICLINELETRIIEQSAITTRVKLKNNKEKKVFIYDLKEKIKEVFKYDKFQTNYITPFFYKRVKCF